MVGHAGLLVVLEYLVDSFDCRPGGGVKRPQGISLQQFVNMRREDTSRVGGNGQFAANSTVNLL